MLYVLEIAYQKEALPILDLWDFIKRYPISVDTGRNPDLNVTIDRDLMEFDDLNEFKNWVEDAMYNNPIFMIIDVEEKSIYYYEVDSTVKFTRLEGKYTFDEMEQQKEKFERLRAEKIEAAKRDRLLQEKESLRVEMELIDNQLNETKGD